MVVGGAAGDVRVEGAPEVRAGVMAADGLAGAHRGGDHRVRVVRAGHQAGEIHHLAEADDALPTEGRFDFGGGDGGAGPFQPRRGGDAGRQLEVKVDRLLARFRQHQFDARHAEDVGHLVRVSEDGRRAVGDHGAGVFGDAQHAALDVHMRVQEAGHQAAAFRGDDFGLRADAIAELRADGGDAAGADGDIDMGDQFAGMGVDPASGADQQVGRPLPHGDRRERLRQFIPGAQSGHGYLLSGPGNGAGGIRTHTPGGGRF